MTQNVSSAQLSTQHKRPGALHRAWSRIGRVGPLAAAGEFFDYVHADSFLHRVPPGNIRSALFFVGSSRSGTTLINTLLSAHPMILLGNEVHAMQMMYEGHSWFDVMRRIVGSAFRFSRTQTWTGYSYKVDYRRPHTPDQLRVIGAKRARETSTTAIAAGGFQDFLVWVPLPVTFLQVVRHPLDVISTQIMRYHRLPMYAIADYFVQQSMAVAALEAVGPNRFITVHLEKFIAQPRVELRRVIERLALPVEEDYLEACAAAVFTQPKLSRSSFAWTAELIDTVRARAADFAHLQPYCADESSWRVDD